MPDREHLKGPTLEVHATDDGLIPCLTCDADVLPSKVYLLLKNPEADTWVGVCRVCSIAVLGRSIFGTSFKPSDLGSMV